MVSGRPYAHRILYLADFRENWNTKLQCYMKKFQATGSILNRKRAFRRHGLTCKKLCRSGATLEVSPRKLTCIANGHVCIVNMNWSNTAAFTFV
jgi:hypothetical protein